MRGMNMAVVVAVAAALTVPSAGTARPGHQLDLSTGRVDGRTLLGRTPAGVRSRLGRPDSSRGTARRHRDTWGRGLEFSVMVMYRRRQGRAANGVLGRNF